MFILWCKRQTCIHGKIRWNILCPLFTLVHPFFTLLDSFPASSPSEELKIMQRILSHRDSRYRHSDIAHLSLSWGWAGSLLRFTSCWDDLSTWMWTHVSSNHWWGLLGAPHVYTAMHVQHALLYLQRCPSKCQMAGGRFTLRCTEKNSLVALVTFALMCTYWQFLPSHFTVFAVVVLHYKPDEHMQNILNQDKYLSSWGPPIQKC